jgi:hypothetical protein
MHYSTSQKVSGSIADEVIGFSNSTNPSTELWPWGSTQPLTEMSTRNLPRGGKERSASKADNLTADCLENVDASTSHNRMGLHGLLPG